METRRTAFGHYDWQHVDGEELERLLKLVNAIGGKPMANAASARVARSVPPFYGNTQLVMLDDDAWLPETGPLWYLMMQGQAFPLEGSSAPIHDANEADPIGLTAENCVEYLRFFCYFVHGDEGRFLIVNSLDHLLDHLAYNGPLDDESRNLIQAAVRPPNLESRNSDGAFEVSATVLYGAALFHARFSINGKGHIVMIDDEVVAAGLPVKKRVQGAG
jgi:hypothetical protein